MNDVAVDGHGYLTDQRVADTRVARFQPREQLPKARDIGDELAGAVREMRQVIGKEHLRRITSYNVCYTKLLR